MSTTIRALVAALCIAGSHVCAAADVSLTGTVSQVDLQLSEALSKHVKRPAASMLLFSIHYPSGESAPRTAYQNKDVVEVHIFPLNAGAPTVAEGYWDGSLPSRLGEQLESNSSESIRIYSAPLKGKYRLYVKAFKGSDGNAVAVREPLDFQVLAKASRRYSSGLRVEYLYPARIDRRAADDFVVEYLQKNVKLKAERPN